MNGVLTAVVAAAALFVPPAAAPERLPGPPAVTLDSALGGERSLLAFLPDDVASGRFTIVAGWRYDR